MERKAKILPHILYSAFFVLCILGIFLVRRTEKDSQTFHQAMYCVEIQKDGTSLPCSSFQLSGEIFTATDGRYRGKRCITLQPLTVDRKVLSTHFGYENRNVLHDMENIPFHRATIIYLPLDKGDMGRAEFTISADLQYCVIELAGRCYVASRTEDFDPHSVLALLDGFLQTT